MSIERTVCRRLRLRAYYDNSEACSSSPSRWQAVFARSMFVRPTLATPVAKVGLVSCAARRPEAFLTPIGSRRLPPCPHSWCVRKPVGMHSIHGHRGLTLLPPHHGEHGYLFRGSRHVVAPVVELAVEGRLEGMESRTASSITSIAVGEKDHQTWPTSFALVG